MTFENKTALITGGSRGIGKAIALRFAREGAQIALVYAGNQSAAQETLSQLEELGVQARAYCCDVSDFEATRELTQQVLSDFGGVDILVNNAGIVRDGLLLSMKEEDLNRVLDINLKGAFHTIRHLYSHFMRKRSGRILNISSVVGLNGNAGQSSYAAAKAGLIGLTKSVAKELAGRNVTCNAIAPGYILSDMTAALPEKIRDAILSSIPSGRPGTPEDVAEAAAFLAGPAAAYITGEVLRVDGGMSM